MCRRNVEKIKKDVLSNAQSSLFHLALGNPAGLDASISQMKADIDALVAMSHSPEASDLYTPAQQRRGGPPDKIAQTVFAQFCRFDDEQLIEFLPLIDARLVAYFLDHPEDLHRLTGRKFEELVAEIFDGFGFAVELTVPTGDYGRDVIAINHTDKAKIPNRMQAMEKECWNRGGPALARCGAK